MYVFGNSKDKCQHNVQYWMLLKRGLGNGEWGMGNGKMKMGDSKWEVRNEKIVRSAVLIKNLFL